jgi:hypothetical protein
MGSVRSFNPSEASAVLSSDVRPGDRWSDVVRLKMQEAGGVSWRILPFLGILGTLRNQLGAFSAADRCRQLIHPRTCSRSKRVSKELIQGTFFEEVRDVLLGVVV